MLEIEVARNLGAFQLDVALRTERSATLVVVGESGSGKTTLLRLLAGLVHPDRGAIRLDGSALFDSRAGVTVPAHERPIGYVAQDYALFPHLDVRENVAFGLRTQRMRGAELRSRVEAALDRLGIAELSGRRPHQLSGGQQQRTALARALVLEPRLLLLDEPLSALDLQTRRTIRGELWRLLDGLKCVTVYVTHSPTEALSFGDRIAVLEQGRVSQQGTRDDLLRHPRTPYVAAFLGVNLFRGTVQKRLDGGLVSLAVEGGEITIAADILDDECFALVDPRDVVLSREAPGGSAQNVFQGTIEEIVPEPPAGDRLRVMIASRPPLAAEVTRPSAEALGMRPGELIYASFKATGVQVFR